MASNPDFGRDTEAETITATFAAQVKGKVILITGVNSKGIGGATGRALAKENPQLLILAGRTQEKVQVVIEEIRAISPLVETRFLNLDLSSQATVRKAAAEVNAYPEKIDILINNAAIMMLPKRQLSADGIELQFATNHLGPFLFTNLIMPKLLAAASSNLGNGATRIVNVSSFGHKFSPVRFSDISFDKPSSQLPASELENRALVQKLGLKDFEVPDLNAPAYDPMAAYGQSKTANILYSLALSRRLVPRGIRCFALHPGSIQTELTRHIEPSTVAGVKRTGQFAYKTLSAGASTQLVAALDPDLKAQGNNVYLDNCQIGDPAPWASDVAAAEMLWKRSEEIMNEKFTF